MKQCECAANKSVLDIYPSPTRVEKANQLIGGKLIDTVIKQVKMSCEGCNTTYLAEIPFDENKALPPYALFNEKTMFHLLWLFDDPNITILQDPNHGMPTRLQIRGSRHARSVLAALSVTTEAGSVIADEQLQYKDAADDGIFEVSSMLILIR